MLPLPRWVRIISVTVFVVSFIAGMGLVSWHEIVEIRNSTALATVVAIIVKGEAVSVVSAAIAGAFEGGAFIVVIAYEMVKRGFDKGRAQAFAEVNKELAAYHKRMQEARAKGEDFTEPLPKFGDDEEDEGQE